VVQRNFIFLNKNEMCVAKVIIHQMIFLDWLQKRHEKKMAEKRELEEKEKYDKIAYGLVSILKQDPKKYIKVIGPLDEPRRQSIAMNDHVKVWSKNGEIWVLFLDDDIDIAKGRIIINRVRDIIRENEMQLMGLQARARGLR
jgi:hypothetical protein